MTAFSKNSQTSYNKAIKGRTDLPAKTKESYEHEQRSCFQEGSCSHRTLFSSHPGRRCDLVSGQLPIDAATGNFPADDIAAQTRQSLENIKVILEEAGYTMADVVKSTVLLKDIADFGAMNEVYGEYFSKPFPARAAFQVGALPKDAKVEIEVVAVKSK